MSEWKRELLGLGVIGFPFFVTLNLADVPLLGEILLLSLFVICKNIYTTNIEYFGGRNETS